MNTKKIALTLASIILIAFLGFYLVFLKNRNKITIKTPSGNVSINNPKKLPDIKPISLDGVSFKENTNYSIDYYPQDQGFIIVILNSDDIQKARDLAEKDFLDTLKLSQKDACKLNVSLTVPFRVNEKTSGINYHLSFCPNGKAFPQ